MKKLLLVLFLSIYLIGCLEKPTDPVDVPVINGDQLLPLAVGNEWVYRDKKGLERKISVTGMKTLPWIDFETKADLGNLETYTLIDSSAFPYLDTLYFCAITPDGIISGEHLAEITNTTSKDTIVKLNFVPKYPKTDSVYDSPGYENTWIHITRYATPAGIFSDVLINRATEPLVMDDGTELIDEVWYKRGVGPIKGSFYPPGELVRYILK